MNFDLGEKRMLQPNTPRRSVIRCLSLGAVAFAFGGEGCTLQVRGVSRCLVYFAQNCRFEVHPQLPSEMNLFFLSVKYCRWRRDRMGL